jgi:hypothetical protein
LKQARQLLRILGRIGGAVFCDAPGHRIPLLPEDWQHQGLQRLRTRRCVQARHAAWEYHEELSAKVCKYFIIEHVAARLHAGCRRRGLLFSRGQTFFFASSFKLVVLIPDCCYLLVV